MIPLLIASYIAIFTASYCAAMWILWRIFK